MSPSMKDNNKSILGNGGERDELDDRGDRDDWGCQQGQRRHDRMAGNVANDAQHEECTGNSNVVAEVDSHSSAHALPASPPSTASPVSPLRSDYRKIRKHWKHSCGCRGARGTFFLVLILLCILLSEVPIGAATATYPQSFSRRQHLPRIVKGDDRIVSTARASAFVASFTSFTSTTSTTPTSTIPTGTRSISSISSISSLQHKPTTTTALQAKFKTFDEMLQNHTDTPLLIDFYAPFCGPCKLMKRELKQIRELLVMPAAYNANNVNRANTVNSAVPSMSSVLQLSEREEVHPIVNDTSINAINADDQTNNSMNNSLPNSIPIPIYHVNTERFPQVGARNQIHGLPTLVLYVEGKEVWRAEGWVRGEEIVREVREVLGVLS